MSKKDANFVDTKTVPTNSALQSGGGYKNISQLLIIVYFWKGGMGENL